MNFKRNICLALLLVVLMLAFAACTKAPAQGDSDLPNGEKDPFEGVVIPDEPIPLEGDVKSIWFEDTFAAYYPSQLDGSVEVIFSKAYFYGEQQTKQPVMCLCSQTITDISLFSLESGSEDQILYTVEKLEPMEVIWIFPELSVEGNANIGISFTDEQGAQHRYALARNADSTEVIVTPINAN